MQTTPEHAAEICDALNLLRQEAIMRILEMRRPSVERARLMYEVNRHLGEWMSDLQKGESIEDMIVKASLVNFESMGVDDIRKDAIQIMQSHMVVDFDF